jgi:hypothetical protein
VLQQPNACILLRGPLTRQDHLPSRPWESYHLADATPWLSFRPTGRLRRHTGQRGRSAGPSVESSWYWRQATLLGQ